MKCSQFHEQAAAYALDALPEDERLACAAHLADEGPHEGCEALLQRFEHAVGRLGELVTSSETPDRVWSAIEQRIGAASAQSARPTRWREATAWALAAAALFAALYVQRGADQRVARLEREQSTIEQSLANTSERLASVEVARQECASALAKLGDRGLLAREAVSFLQHPATEVTPLAPAGARPYRATALYNPETKRALVVSSGIEPVEGKDFELWVIAGKEAPKPAGFLRFDASGVALGEFDPTLLTGGKPGAFAISLEPAGGRPTPTEVVLLGKLQG
jgi:anti-sigma-K factor RskA